MVPRPRLLGALLLGGALFTYGATSEVAWLFLFAYLAWALAIAAFAYALWNDAGLAAGLRLLAVEPGPRPSLEALPEGLFRDAPLPAPIFEGDSVEIQLELVSRRGARGPARLTATFGGATVAAGTGLVAATGWSQRRRLGPLRRGPLQPDGLLLEVGDPLGFFRHRRRQAPVEVGAVLPLFASLGRAARPREVEAVLTAVRPGPGNELYGVREYRAGDPLRRIHWKTSARRGELVVRELEPPGLRTLGLLLEPAPPTPAIADQLARLAASEAWDCIRAGGRVSIWAPGRRGLEAAAGGSLWAVLDWLARYPELPSEAFEAVPSAAEVVGFCSRPGELGPELSRLAARGVDVRGWVVGEEAGGGELPVPHRRVGLEWPL